MGKSRNAGVILALSVRLSSRELAATLARRNGPDRAWVAMNMARGHTITVSPAGRHIEISLGGVKLAESDRAVRLEETGLQDRYYLPREDVRTEYLRPSAAKTTCPFKGEASYWSIALDGSEHPDLVWSYEDPIPQAAGIAGLMCFYAEHVDQQVS